MLAIGARAPEFTLPDQDGREVSLSNFLSRGALLLYFYPSDFTPICTREACAIRDMHQDIERAGLRIVGISPQGARASPGFSRPLQSAVHASRRSRQVGGENVRRGGIFGLRLRRVTYLIDPKRIVRDVVRANFRIGPHEALIRRALSTRA